MKKYLVVVVVSMIVGVPAIFAQSETDRQASNNSSKENEKLQLALRSKPPASDKTQVLDVVGIRQSIFTVSNTADGTVESYNHSKRITLEITASNNTEHEVVFYTPEEKIPFVYSSLTGKSTIYYPMSMYDDIKQKFDQSMTAKKKIQLRIIEKTTGFREVSLIF
jgi:hypothetical protein